MSLWSAAQHIVEEGRAAGHSEIEVWAALYYVDETGTINGAWKTLYDMREKNVPRWLIQRWAADAGLTEPRHNPHN